MAAKAKKKVTRWSLARRTKFEAAKARKMSGRIIQGKEPAEVIWQSRKEAPDPVNHPAHYTSGKIEVTDFIEDQNLGMHLGNAVKYIARAGKKPDAPELQDLKKARWYLNRRIANLEKEDKT